MMQKLPKPVLEKYLIQKQMKHDLKDFEPVPRTLDLTPGDSLRIMRELQEMSQNQLSDVSGIPQSTISAIENGRANLGVDRAKTFARALRCHPSVLLFSGWDIDKESAA